MTNGASLLGHYSLGFVLSMMAVSSIVAIAATIWWNAISLRHMQAVQDQALRIGQQQKESLLRLAKQLEQAHTFREVLSPTLAEINPVMGYRTAWAYLFSEDGSTATLLAVGGPLADFVRESLPVLTVRGDPFLEAIFAATGPVIVEDARLDPRTNKQIVEQLQNRTIINVPLMLADRRIGALGTGTFGDEGIKRPTPDQLEYFSAMSTHVAAALDRIKLLEERARVNAELERRVAARTAQLEAANKELEAFSYSVSHDLRAPLRHIDAFSRILLDEHAQTLDESAKRYLSVIRGGAQNMGRMIDDLLQLSRLDRQDADRRPTDLGTLVRDVVQELQHDAGERSIEWIIGPLPEVICDTGLIKLAFSNLLSNAVKYTKYQPHAVIQVGAVDGSNPAAIFVRDNGAGFDPRYADKLFGVFQRLHRKEEFEGTGVGLATVHRVVRKHGGRIWAESGVGKGATFFLTLEGDT